MPLTTADNLLAGLLPEWHMLLQGWSATGRLTAAAQAALLLDGEPKALTDLTNQWAAGDFGALQPIVLLSAADINGALGAYAAYTGKIYLNADWFATATQEAVNAVLTEELGHHLDALLNIVDTPGDEGEVFSNILGNKLMDSLVLKQQEDKDYVTISGKTVAAEFASTARSIQNGMRTINSLGALGQGLAIYNDYYGFDWQTIVGTSATGEYLATPFNISLAEKYTTPAGFDVWTIWKDAGKTRYISLIPLKIEEISFGGTYVSNNGGPIDAIPRLLSVTTNTNKGVTWGFKGSASNELFLGETSLFITSDQNSTFVVAGGDGIDTLFIPLVKASHRKIERNSLDLSRISYTDTNGQISQYITTGIENVDYIDIRYDLTDPSNYNLINGTARGRTNYGQQALSVLQASGTDFEGGRTLASTLGSTGNDLILAGARDYSTTVYNSFDGLAGSDVLLFDNFTRANLGNATQQSPSQWRLTFGGLVIIANNIEYLQLQDMAVQLNADGTTKNLAWQIQYIPGPVTVNGVNLGKIELGYALKNGVASPLSITNAGAVAGPIAGWSAFAAASNGSGYDLYWENTNGSYAKWFLNSSAALTSSAVISTAAFLQDETNLGVDLDGDGTTGLTFTPIKTVGAVQFGATQLGYALKNGVASPLSITNAGAVAGPVAGWAALAAATNGSGYNLYWKNTNGAYAKWALNSSAALATSTLLTTANIYNEEVSSRFDLNQDGTIGPLAIQLGTSQNDSLTGGPFKATFGLGGNDTLNSGSPYSQGFDILIGGAGDDTYNVATGRNALIADSGSSLGSNNRLTALGIGLFDLNTVASTIDNRKTLVIENELTQTLVYFYDWQNPVNQIQTISLSDGNFTFQQIRSTIISLGSSIVDYTWAGWVAYLGDNGLANLGLTQPGAVDSLATYYQSVNTQGLL